MAATANRRDFLATAAATGVGVTLGSSPMSQLFASENSDLLYDISVAQYSLHRMIGRGELDPLDFGPFCREKFDVDAIEYWMGPFADKATDRGYIEEMDKRSRDAGVKQLLIMVDIGGDDGTLGHPDSAKRQRAVQNHYPWVENAKRMGCHSIRVNARSEGDRDEQARLVADGLRRLCEFGAKHEINILVENHGGLSSDGSWLVEVMELVDLPNCGTLPDFGNFRIGTDEDGNPIHYDRYQGVAEMMPYAKAVSAKSHEFDEEGNETGTDYHKMMQIVVDSGYRGYVGIEWEGRVPESEVEGVLLTKRLLERVRDSLSG